MPKEDLRAKIEKKLQVMKNATRNFGDTLEFYIPLQAGRPDCSWWLDEEGQVVNARIYKSVDMPKDTFSKMLGNPKYHPSKLNVCKIAFALHLDLEHTEELLHLAGYGFSGLDTFDIVLKTFIENGEYSVEALDEELYRRGLDTFMGEK